MLRPELPGPGDRIVDLPEGKIHLSQLSVIGAAKVSHFEITCRDLNIIPTLSLFRVFYTPSFNSGWMSFSKRPRKNTPQCYTKPLDSLKNWNNRFFCVDERIFQTVVDWRINASKHGMPVNGTYSVEAVRALDTHRTPIQKQPEMLLCLVRISRRYYLGDEVYPTFHYDDDREIDLFSLICALNPTKVKTGSRPCAPHEVPLLTLIASRVIEMDEPTVATDSSGVPSAIEMSPLDFVHEDGASDQGTAAPEMPPPEDVHATTAPGVGQAEETVAAEPPVAQESRKRGHDGVDANAPPMSLRRDHADLRPSGSSHGGKSLAAMQLCLASNVFASEGVPVDVSDPDLLSFADAPSHHPVDVAQSSQGIAAVGDPKSENVSSPAEVGSPGSVAMGSQLRLRFEQEVKLLRKFVAQVARRDERIKARELEIKKLETLLETEADMKRAAGDKSAGLIKELEDMRARFSDLQVSHGQLSQQVASLKEQVSGEEKLKAAFKEFKRYEDERVERRCAELDACLDALSIDFVEELYPHMLIAIAGRRWVVGHGLCLAMMKCAESLEMRQAFADVVSAGVAKGMSEGLKHEVEHGQAQLMVESIEAYDPEAEAKFFVALQSLKDLKSDNVLVSVPMVVPQGLALLLVDAATQTDLEDA
nr:transposase (putative), gypsy type [Tanacetum cinerariifolium]